ncbi:(2Fe-2S)-binding protein [Breoghania sp. L-A4]|uniref:(2Fe-2S)-binding protein n=1 Tax=Breoghania sp. L-A4 TaxID=2304600 RepID=UPI0013C2AD9D|nr:(2Fe-2S)-binding protein [Breoghania sp. L-A4]
MFTVKINGTEHQVDADGDTPMLWVLRDELGLTGTKFGCGIASCGACTVHVDGTPTRSCQFALEDAAGVEITTIEHLTAPDSTERVATAVRDAWRELDVVQCGYCQSGQIMQAIGLLSENAKPSDEDITDYMDGNVCRCGTYGRIRAAILKASATLEG